jgi:hypothetical protein
LDDEDEREALMAETPQDPMQAAAYARVVANELALDAQEQANNCAQGGDVIKMLAESMTALGELVCDGPVYRAIALQLAEKHGVDVAAIVKANPGPAQEVRAAFASIVESARAIGLGLDELQRRFLAHGEGWTREALVWERLMTPVATPPSENKP